MKRPLLTMALWMVAGCGGGVPEPKGTGAALITDPWQGIYAVRQIASNRFVVNPLGGMQITCYDGVPNQECVVPRLSLTGTGLPPARQQEIRNRLPSEPPDERSASVVLKTRW